MTATAVAAPWGHKLTFFAYVPGTAAGLGLRINHAVYEIERVLGTHFTGVALEVVQDEPKEQRGS